MMRVWVSLKGIPTDGREFSFSNPKLWIDPWEEFGMPYTMGEPPLIATLLLIPHPNGCYVKGHLTGAVNVPCDRCIEPAIVALDSHVDEYEEIESQPRVLANYMKRRNRYKVTLSSMVKSGLLSLDKPRLLRWHRGELELDIGSLLWEMFILAMPVKPLCSPACLGLCPICGQYMPKDSCRCTATTADDNRLTVLHSLKREK